jgi:hypothetical protein
MKRGGPQGASPLHLGVSASRPSPPSVRTRVGGFAHHDLARPDHVPGRLRVVCTFEHVCIAAEGDGRVGVSKLSGCKHDGQPLGDDEGDGGVARRVRCQPPRGGDATALHGRARALAAIVVVQAAPERVGEDEADRRLVRGGERVRAGRRLGYPALLLAGSGLETGSRRASCAGRRSGRLVESAQVVGAMVGATARSFSSDQAAWSSDGQLSLVEAAKARLGRAVDVQAHDAP